MRRFTLVHREPFLQAPASWAGLVRSSSRRSKRPCGLRTRRARSPGARGLQRAGRVSYGAARSAVPPSSLPRPSRPGERCLILIKSSARIIPCTSRLRDGPAASRGDITVVVPSRRARRRETSTAGVERSSCVLLPLRHEFLEPQFAAAPRDISRAVLWPFSSRSTGRAVHRRAAARTVVPITSTRARRRTKGRRICGSPVNLPCRWRDGCMDATVACVSRLRDFYVVLRNSVRLAQLEAGCRP